MSPEFRNRQEVSGSCLHVPQTPQPGLCNSYFSSAEWTGARSVKSTLLESDFYFSAVRRQARTKEKFRRLYVGS